MDGTGGLSGDGVFVRQWATSIGVVAAVSDTKTILFGGWTFYARAQ